MVNRPDKRCCEFVIPEHLRDAIMPMPIAAMATQSDKKCDSCKRPIYKSVVQWGKWYCSRCRKYFT